METKTARTIMRTIDVCLNPTMTLDKVSDHLSMHHLPGSPVVDENGNGVGYISEYDCLQQLMQATYYCDKTSLAEDVMSHKLISTNPDISLIDLASKMNESKLNVIAVQENDKIVGIISRGDIMRALVDDLAACAIPEAV